MRIITGNNAMHAVLRMYHAVINGRTVASRVGETREIRNLALILPTEAAIVTDFTHRKLNLDYCKREWMWYLKAEATDDSIVKYAKTWEKLAQPDGTYFSNYGVYMFGTRGKATGESATQFGYVVQELRKNPNSRRASIVLLNRDHLFHENVDTVCTYSINFAIVNSALDMTVMMRSNDVIFGFTNDAFCFSQLYEFVYQLLLRTYPALTRGQYVHFANSMHVYERHYDMIRAILQDPARREVLVPKPTPTEVVQLVQHTVSKGEPGVYTKWLKAVNG